MSVIKNISLLLPDEPIQDPYEDEITFNNTVREYILFGVVLLVLLIASHLVILWFRRKEISSTFPHCRSHHQYDDEAVVDRVALWLCTFSLSISLGAVLLLPISILTNEVLTIYRDSLYVRWINLSLIQGLWNMIFLCSNLSLFVGLPFAYLFTESEGFPGSKKSASASEKSVTAIWELSDEKTVQTHSHSSWVKRAVGIKARIIETVVVLTLLVVLVLGVSFIISFLLGYYEQESIAQTFEVWGSFYLPFLYSLISCLGVLFLLLCTPVGFAHLFTVLGQLVLKPSGFLGDLAEEYQAALMQEEALARRLERMAHTDYQMLPIRRSSSRPPLGSAADSSKVLAQYSLVREMRIKLEGRRRAGVIKRTLAYPLAFLLLLVMTGAAVAIVGLNTLQLLVGIKALPLSSAPAILGETQQGKRMVLLSMLGPIGAILEVLLILYLIAASMFGCYSLPFLKAIKPRRRDTPMTDVIANCLVVLLLSSALPLLVRALGITNFDLLGDYGKISWLGHFWIILGYNVLFASAAASCLVKKFTATLRHEIMLRFIQIGQLLWRRFHLKGLPVADFNRANVKDN